MSQTLGGDDLLAVQRRRRDQAGVDRRPGAAVAVGIGLQHHHGARTALALGAALLGAGQSAATQPVQQGDLPTDLAEGTELTVDTHAGHRHHAPIHDTPKRPVGAPSSAMENGCMVRTAGRGPQSVGYPCERRLERWRHM